jgi:hypothetical protein
MDITRKAVPSLDGTQIVVKDLVCFPNVASAWYRCAKVIESKLFGREVLDLSHAADTEFLIILDFEQAT